MKIILLFLIALPMPMPMENESAAKEIRPIVIAHRGASGYLPEHTGEAVALAFGMGADYIEQDVVLTKDYVPIVLHDVFLDLTTNVEEVFPDRKRGDGRYYAIDFKLAEIKKLKVNERKAENADRSAFKNRFPPKKGRFYVPTLAEEIELIQGLNCSLKKNVGIYPEIKHPKFHRDHRADISKIVLDVLASYGYVDKSQKVYLQCFDSDELERISNELNCKLPLIQLIESGNAEMLSENSLQKLALNVQGIGPHYKDVLDPRSSLVKAAKNNGLEVHPYTFRADSFPKAYPDFNSFVSHFQLKIQVTGMFTDHPDKTLSILNKNLIK